MDGSPDYIVRLQIYTTNLVTIKIQGIDSAPRSFVIIVSVCMRCIAHSIPIHILENSSSRQGGWIQRIDIIFLVPYCKNTLWQLEPTITYPESHPALCECQQGTILQSQRERYNSHPSTFSTAVCGRVHLIASSELCVLSSLHTALLQRALSALWRLSPFQPKT